MSQCLFGVEAICISKHEITGYLVNIYAGVLCVGLDRTLTRDRVQEVAHRTLQQRRTVTSRCQTMSPVTKSRAENLQTSTVFTLKLETNVVMHRNIGYLKMVLKGRNY